MRLCAEIKSRDGARMKLSGLTEQVAWVATRWATCRTFSFGALALCLSLVVVSCAPAAGQIELSQTESNWGTVSNGTSVSRTFEVHNAGAGPLAITAISTSCGCTTAEIGDRRLGPGETAVLQVTYDPLVHDGATGEFLRMVYVRSDDPDTPEAALSIRLRVVEQPEGSR